MTTAILHNREGKVQEDNIKQLFLSPAMSFGKPKFPHNKSLPRLGNNRKHPTRSRVKRAIAQASRKKNR